MVTVPKVVPRRPNYDHRGLGQNRTVPRVSSRVVNLQCHGKRTNHTHHQSQNQCIDGGLRCSLQELTTVYKFLSSQTKYYWDLQRSLNGKPKKYIAADMYDPYSTIDIYVCIMDDERDGTAWERLYFNFGVSRFVFLFVLCQRFVLMKAP